MDRRIPVRSLNRRVSAGDGEDGAELGDLCPTPARRPQATAPTPTTTGPASAPRSPA